MLRLRVLTALVLVPLVILAIWTLPTAWVAGLVAALMLGCAWEWGAFVPLAGAGRYAYLAACALGLFLLHPLAWGQQIAPGLLILVLCWWGAAALWLQVYPRGFTGAWQPPLRILLGLLATLGCYTALWNLHALEQGRWLVFLLLAIVWATDTGGYFAGKRFGRRKLAPQISPNKTWEGLWGGVVLAALLAAAASAVIVAPWWMLMGLGLVVALISVVGDLTVSMFKRQSGVKDTGRLFPGHGGALDRLDSLLSAAPVLLAGCWLLEVGL